MRKLGRREGRMNKDELKGKLDHLKGRVKDAAEALTGKEKHAGSAEGGATEKIKQAGERAADTARDKADTEETDDE
jgi:uncharacterized protein YjbJ (UPF0337 family)